MEPKKVLVAPLDWGLGHATRCIPVIQELIAQRCLVFIASSGSALVLLKQEFPFLTFFEIEPYNPVYAEKNLLRGLIFQLPRFHKVIAKEHEQIEKLVLDNDITYVLSDNRYGCWSYKTTNVLITHQLTLQVPLLSSVVNFFHKLAIHKFSLCWVPDVPGCNSLAGKLTVNSKIKATFIGFLTRMEWRPSIVQYEIMAIISGPEPQRTTFENLVRGELKKTGRRCLMIKGLPGIDTQSLSGRVEEVNHLSSKEMNQVILDSEIILSRSGYSTIMDLAVLGKKAIFVPTPGQTEQEYLANELKNKKIAYSISQDKFNLQDALEQSGNFLGFTRTKGNSELQKSIQELLK